MPTKAYEQVLSMLYRAGLSQDTFACDSGLGGHCTLNAPCSSYVGFTDALAFQIKFEESENYLIVPLAAFAFDNTTDSTCTVYIQNLNTTIGTPVVLGTMFLSQYVAYFENDYSDGNTQRIQLTPSSQTSMP